MSNFKITSNFQPTGDQPRAIEELTRNFLDEVRFQTLWGVTGSGKTFTMANVVANIQKPTLVIVHNKTLAAQLADEFRKFFPDNAVHYFVSYYDYYQPEAYIPQTDTYIEKDSSINDEIDRLRHAATHALLTRSDVLIVASVSCLYGIGSPEFYRAENVTFKSGQTIKREDFLKQLTNLQYQRNDYEVKRGTFRLKGETLEIFPAYSNNSLKIEFFGDTVEKITEKDWMTGRTIATHAETEIYPAKHFVTPDYLQKEAVIKIQHDLEHEVSQFKRLGKLLEAERLEQRTNFDLEMLQETGSCSGVENYSRYFDNRKIGEPPTTLLDYFPPDFALFVDESHVTLPQIHGMFGGDHSRKEKLIEYGFRLKAAFDNRPLRFEEFSQKINKAIFVSATPGAYELTKSSRENEISGKKKEKSAIIRQFIRPTGLLDPVIEIRSTNGQVENLITEIKKVIDRGERILVTTLTKKMAEELSEFLKERSIKVMYLHSDIATLERSEILHALRLGKYDVIVGINLLREGLDLPEVSLVTILDADKEGFLRSKTSLIQSMGRAARHVNGKVIMYADVITESMRGAIEETNQRRLVQEEYNKTHHITPTGIDKEVPPEVIKEEEKLYNIESSFKSLPKKERAKVISDIRGLMKDAAGKLEFERAAELRDQIVQLESANQ